MEKIIVTLLVLIASSIVSSAPSMDLKADESAHAVGRNFGFGFGLGYPYLGGYGYGNPYFGFGFGFPGFGFGYGW